MSNPQNKLDWCVVRLGNDMNWWVEEISDSVNWDVDSLSIIDPRQINYVVELLEPLYDYGFDKDYFEAAFYSFRIAKTLPKKKIRLVRIKDSILDSDEPLFALPDIIDEENGPYADFLDHIIKLRVKLLNDAIDFEQELTVDELEEEIRETENADFIEGTATHLFSEIVRILEYVPAGYELDKDSDDDEAEDEDEVSDDDIPDLEDDEDEEILKQDKSLRWDEDDEEEKEEEFEDEDIPPPAPDEDLGNLDDLKDDDEEEESPAPKKKKSPKKKKK